MEKEVEIAKRVIIEEVERAGYKVLKILLFGSRVKGTFNKDSDWDFYVIVDEELSFPKKRKIIAEIRKKLAELKIPNDIIIQSNSIANEKRNDVGYLTYYVFKEGIEI